MVELFFLLGVGVFLHIVEYVLHIVVVLKFLKELVESLALLGSDLLEVVWHAHELIAHDFEAVLLKILLNVSILLEST